ncbi:MAG: helix-turn-helix transcriptional regulator, partial [Oscillospiraceae bacterium]|nr:helix-turn-helix transcriptional regulator [Oscillospiraceae bacterium]
MNIFQFITTKAKREGFKRDDLAKMINVSKTTMHRYVHGELIITPERAQALAKVLNLSKKEKVELHNLITYSIPHRAMQKTYKEMQKAYAAMDTLIFGEDEIRPVAPFHEVLFLSADRVILTANKMLDRFLLHCSEENFECTVRIIHGISEVYISRLADLAEILFARVPHAIIEHLIPMTLKDSARTINLLTATLPLLKHPNYLLFYSKNDQPDGINSMFNSMIYVSTSYEKNGRRRHENFLMSFPKHSRAVCHMSSDPLLHEMITNEYFDVRLDYESAFHEFRNVGVGEEFLIELEQNHDVSLLKPNPCYSHIPAEAYDNLMSRMDLKSKREMALGIAGTSVPDEDVDDTIAWMMDSVKTRVATSHTKKQSAVCSKSGLREFAQTGRLTDHAAWLPPFNKKEIQMCLESIRDRNRNKKDPFTLYITEKDILDNGYLFCACKGDGLFIEYNNEGNHVYPNKNLYIKNKVVADV